jgi:quinol monooxygenase YgiN
MPIGPIGLIGLIEQKGWTHARGPHGPRGQAPVEHTMTDQPADRGNDVELHVVVATFHARPGSVEALGALLARYVVLTRRDPACRNVDLVASVLEPGRLVVIEKWESAQAQRVHLDAPETVAMAEGCRDLLVRAPHFDLCEGISAHDLA